MSRKLVCYFGTDVWTGAVRMFVPELFAAEMYYNSEGKLIIGTTIDPIIIGEMSLRVIQNNLPYREAVILGGIYKSYVSKKIVKKIERYLLAGETEKAEKKVQGYSRARLNGYLEEIYSVLEEMGDLTLGPLEKREMEPVRAYCYRLNESYVLRIPHNLLATLTPDGGLDINVRPEVIKGDARRNIPKSIDDSCEGRLVVSRGFLNKLERACFKGDTILREELVRDAMEGIVSHLKRNNGD